MAVQSLSQSDIVTPQQGLPVGDAIATRRLRLDVGTTPDEPGNLRQGEDHAVAHLTDLGSGVVVSDRWFLLVQRSEPTLEATFRILANVWHRETGYLSSITEKSLHPAYQQIIGLGPAIVPVLLRDLERKPDHWFWALGAITRANPVPAEDEGNIARMAAAWVAFGKREGYL